MAQYDYMIGLFANSSGSTIYPTSGSYTLTAGSTAGSGVLTNVESLTVEVAAPKSTFQEYGEGIPLGDGSIRGAGWKSASWRWGYMTQAQRDQLAVYCTGASANVIIQTRTNSNSDAYKTYSAIMVKPQSEDKDASRRIDYLIEFRNLKEIA